MTDVDFPTVIGALLSCWALGWGLGFAFYSVKRGIERIY